MPKRYTFVKKLRLLTFGSVNYASTAGGYAAVTKGLNQLFKDKLL